MALTLYNTLTREKQPFEPIDPAHARMYVCGPTVYDFAHIGNARPVVVFDVLYRLLGALYPKVTYVRNITDVDDKIIDASNETGEPIDRLTVRTTAAYHDDMAALGAQPPDVEPRATRTIPEMIEIIEQLIAQGHAYEAEGHVLFDVPSCRNYGGLSRNKRDEIVVGARVDVAPYKKDAADFVLWKPSTGNQPGWDSPWGFGRPGWHTECVAMSEKHLGVPFDIHGGGQDLIFPHHENEIAQSACLQSRGEYGASFAKFWVHNGYLMVEGEKMSKSLGNFFTVRQLLEEGWPGEVIRLVLLSTHYRQPLDFTREKLKEAKAQLDRLYGALRGHSVAEMEALRIEKLETDPVMQALANDLNMPDALHSLHAQAGEINKTADPTEKLKAKRRLRQSASVLGLLQSDPETWFQGAATESDDAGEIESLIDRRRAAREARDFAEADRIRDELDAMGVVLEDGPDGTTWRRAG